MSDQGGRYAFAEEKPWLAALMDEYARAIEHLGGVVQTIPLHVYESRSRLSDEESPHIRGIMEHVAGAAHRYGDYLETMLTGEDVSRRAIAVDASTPDTAMSSVRKGFRRTVNLLAQTMGRSDEELAKLTVVTRWGQRYDMEQMLEHAIVHILRHRRQIERWLVVDASP